jgi:hypothetical protein
MTFVTLMRLPGPEPDVDSTLASVSGNGANATTVTFSTVMSNDPACVRLPSMLTMRTCLAFVVARLIVVCATVTLAVPTAPSNHAKCT